MGGTSIIDNMDSSETATLPVNLGESTISTLRPDTPILSVQYNALSRGEQDMIVNVTREYPFDYATIMFGYIMPFVLVLTLITNTLVVMVLAQRHMRTPTNIVLFTMAIVDLMTLLSPSPWYIYIYTLGYHDKFLHPPFYCYAHYIMTDVVPVFFHTSSIWLALLLASQRYIYVCHPSLASAWCTVPRVRKAIMIILLVAFLHQSTRFFDNTFVSVYIQYDSGYHLACKNEIADWVNKLNVAMYYTTYFTFRIFFVFIIPCVALITLNCLLFRALHRADNKRTELLKTKFKLIGNSNNCSTGITKQSSFALDRRQSGINNTEVGTSGIMFGLSRKISSGFEATFKLNNRDNRNSDDVHYDDSNGGPEKRRNFSITSFQIRRNRNRKQNFRSSSSKQKKMTKDGKLITIEPTTTTATATNNNNNQLSETKLSCSTYEEKISNNISIDGASRRHVMKQTSEESNLSCPLSGGTNQTTAPISISTTTVAGRNQRPVSNIILNTDGGEQTKGQHRRRQQHRHHQHIDMRSNEEEDNNNNESGSEDNEEDGMRSGRDEDFTCPECAACEQSEMIECNRCAAAVSATQYDDDDNNGADGNHRRQHLHQPISQCSSILGGATNNTTNEDVSSSCVVTQNASSSMLVAHDETMEGIEGASIKDGVEDIDVDQESSLINCLVQNTKQPVIVKSSDRSRKEKNNDTNNLANSGSVDSHLICGCSLGQSEHIHNKQTNFQPIVSSLASERKIFCQECCLSDECNQTSPSNIKENPRGCGGSTKTLSSSNTDQSIDCDNLNLNHNKKKQQLDNSGKEVKISQLEPLLSKSQSDYEMSRDNVDDNYKLRNTNEITTPVTAAAAMPTNTNTTMNPANSAGSLQQVQQQQQQQQQQLGSSNDKGGLTSGRISVKNASFVGIIGGRNRYSSNPPPLIVGGGNNLGTTTSATMRTMDSNRTTLMLIVVVTVFLMVEVPVAIVTILHVVLNTFEVFKDVEFGASLNYIKLFTNFFIMISYSVNFTIYCSMSKKFRETFRDLFLCGRRARRKRARRMLYQQQQQQQQSQQQSQYNQLNQLNTATVQDNQLSITSLAVNNSTNLNNDNNASAVANTNINANLIQLGGNTATISSGLNQNQVQNQPQLNQNSSFMRYYPYRRANSQQQECEL